MKKVAMLIQMILCLFAFCACAGLDVPKTPEPAGETDAPTETPTLTLTPTPAPTPTPTPAPTPAPTLTPCPLPTPSKLGNLIGGPLLPEQYRYFVLKGEGDLFYIYDTMGELVEIKKYGGYYYDRSLVGVYREYDSIGKVEPSFLTGRRLITDYGDGTSGVFAGIKYKGEWIFRIYDPSLASDSQRTIVYDQDW